MMYDENNPFDTHFQLLSVTLFQPWGTYYAYLVTTGTPGFSDLPTALTTGVSK